MLPSSTVENYLKAIHHGQSALPKGQRLLPMGHVCPPFGTVTVIWIVVMVKSPSLVSQTLGMARLQMRTRACVVAGAVTVQLKVPVLAALAEIVDQDDPLSLDTSIFTFPVSPTDVHLIAWGLPTPQTSPPFGAVTVIEPRIVSAVVMNDEGQTIQRALGVASDCIVDVEITNTSDSGSGAQNAVRVANLMLQKIGVS